MYPGEWPLGAILRSERSARRMNRVAEWFTLYMEKKENVGK